MDQEESAKNHYHSAGFPSSSSSASHATPGFHSRILREALHWGNESLKMSLQSSDFLIPGGEGVGKGSGNPLLDYGEQTEEEFASPSTWNNVSSAMGLLNQTDFMMGGDNDSFAEPYFPHYIRTTSTLLCGIILFIGIVGNLLVPVVVWKNKELRSSTNIFLVNLSVADLLILLVCMPPVLVELHSKPEVWVLGAAMCKLVPFAELSVAHASVLTILAISLERYIAICRPLRANYTCTKHRAVALCIAIWIIGFVATSPMLAIAQHKTLRYIDRSIHNACLTQAHNFWAQLYFLSSIVIFFFLPLLTLIGLYWVISKNLMSDPSGAGRCCPDHPTMRARRQVVIMLATVVFFFFICLLPFRVFTMYIILAPDSWVESMGQELYYNVLYFCRVMLYLNSSINPVLYNVMSSKFREAFFKVLGCPVGSQRRNQWLCRHLSRQSTFTTSSTLPTSSIKTQHYHHHHGKSCCGNGDSVRIRELTGVGVVIPDQPKNGHFHGKHVRALRATSGPYYPSNQPPPKRQLSTDAAVVHTQVVNVKEKKSMIRANSVV